jgi:hypothetical protein
MTAFRASTKSTANRRSSLVHNGFIIPMSLCYSCKARHVWLRLTNARFTGPSTECNPGMKAGKDAGEHTSGMRGKDCLFWLHMGIADADRATPLTAE